MKRLSGEERDLERARELPCRLLEVQRRSVRFNSGSEVSLESAGAEFVQERELWVYTKDI